MFNSGILDVAIGLAVVFILISTVCTAVREALESVLKTRAAYLEYAVRELLSDREGVGLAKAFFTHPLISGLFQDDYKSRPLRPTTFAQGGSMPSYIPARNFAATLVDIVARGRSLDAPSGSTRVTLDSLRQSVSQLQNPFVERALMTAIDSAEGDLERMREHLEAWFDAAMDRVSGWYKRATQKIIFAIALVVVFALNVNAIAIANTLYRDQSVRAAAVAVAQDLKPDQINSSQLALQKLDALRLPIGWNASLGDWLKHASTPEFSVWNDLVTPLLGLLLTAFAATLGAPFWFDVLNRVMVIRATVKPHEKSPEEGSEDRQLPRSAAPSSAAPIVQVVTADASSHVAGLPTPNPENDVDCCGAHTGTPTPDEALPPATGGVQST